MEPKFQSSFIPKGPTASSSVMPSAPIRKERSILSFLATLIFSLSVIAAVGVLGYKFYLNYSIKSMAAELETGKANLEQDTVDEIRRLNNRILATEDLINSHVVLSPLFDFLESATFRNVRFTEFDYSASEKGLGVIMRGEARGYSALALQADFFNKNKNFQNPVFSDLSLDQEGSVVFSFQASLNPSLVSYQREVERINSLNVPVVTPAATSTASSTTSTTRAVAPTSTTTPRATTTAPRN